MKDVMTRAAEVTECFYIVPFISTIHHIRYFSNISTNCNIFTNVVQKIGAVPNNKVFLFFFYPFATEGTLFHGTVAI